jgi:hypothetical protein
VTIIPAEKVSTAQQVFDRSYLFLVAQGKPSKDPVAKGGCRYRGPDGLACAAGALITDQEYVAFGIVGHEGDEWIGLSVRARLRAHQELIAALQNAHDLPTFGSGAKTTDEQWLADFKRMAKQVAEDFGLIVPPEVAS